MADNPSGMSSNNGPETDGAGAAAASGRVDLEQVRPILPALVDSLSDAVVVVDREHRVVAANRRYIEVFGSTNEVLGTVCREVLNCPERMPAHQTGRDETCAACEVFALKRPQRRVRSLPSHRGHTHRWEGTFSPVMDAGQEVAYVVEVWRDISEMSRLESQLSHSERLASLGLLAAGVAHEINNPVASMLAGVESLLRWLRRSGLDPETASEAREVLEVLESEARRCGETTEKLMLLAQPYQVAAGWCDLNRAVRDTETLLRYALRKQNVRIVDQLSPTLPRLWGRDSGLRGACMNLMMNAVQAMPAGGTLTVRTRRLNDRVALEIEDTGPGIPPELFDRIWDPFFTTKPVGQGTGLGLSITSGIVSRHGGTIRAENLAEGGARFTVELPIAGSGGEGE